MHVLLALWTVVSCAPAPGASEPSPSAHPAPKATGALTWYPDLDGDGYGDLSRPRLHTDPGPLWVADGGDCDDGDSSIHPGASEACDGVDRDCDGEAWDPDGVDAPSWFRDLDGDGYGDATASVPACTQPAGMVSRVDDCDDADPTVYAAGVERVGDGIDNDCDPTTLDDDADGDGVGASDDCDDEDPSILPGATELCDGVDEDCDGSIDEGAAGREVFYADEDGDGNGAGFAIASGCTPGEGESLSDDDCDDSDPSVHTGAGGLCGDGADNDCDGTAMGCGLVGNVALDQTGLTISASDSANDLGRALVTGDLDGDGQDDLVLGASDSDGSTVGAVRAFHRWGPGQWEDTDSTGHVFTTSTVAYLGGALAVTEDADGDGLRDLLIGRTNGAGAVLARGPVVGTLSADHLSYALEHSDGKGTGAGEAVAGGGDWDGDGLAELVVGAPDDGSTGSVAWFAAPERGTTGSDDALATLAGTTSGGGLGAALLVTDLDGDGVADLAAGAPDAEAGAVVVVYGPVTGAVSDSDADVVLLGEASGDGAGAALAAGDTDGDGVPDLVIGAPDEDTGGTNGGAVYLVVGPVVSGTLSGADAQFIAEANNDDLGTALCIGDLDADGLGDLAASAPWRYSDGKAAGAVYVEPGPLSGVIDLATPSFRALGDTNKGYAGEALACVQDHDGDGADDLLVAAPHDGRGEVWLLEGGPGW